MIRHFIGFNNKKLLLFIIISCLIFIINQTFIRVHYANDSINFRYSFEDSILHMSANGRVLIMILWQFINSIGLDLFENQSLFSFFSFLLLSISTYLIVDTYLTIRKVSGNFDVFIAIASSILIICNPFTADLNAFSYMLPFTSIEVLLLVFSARILVQKYNLKNIIRSYILVSLSLLLYQGWGALFVGLSLTLFFIKYQEESYFKLFKGTVVIITIYGMAALTNLLYIKKVHPLFFDFTTNRTKGNIDFTSNLNNILHNQKNVWIDHFNMIPKYSFLLFVTIVFIIYFFLCMKKQGFTRKFKFFLLPIVLFIAINIFSYAPHLFTSDIWITQRSILAISAIPGFFGLLLCSQLKKGDYKKVDLIYAISTIIYLLFILVNMNSMASDLITTNKLDNEVALSIQQSIERKEEENGIDVTKIALSYDQYPTWSYEGMRDSRDLFTRAMVIDWAIRSQLLHVSGVAYEVVPMDEKQKEEFMSKDWSHFSDEQVVVNGDTANIALY